MANYGYVRVSIADENEDEQVKALENYNIDKWFKDYASVKDANRPGLHQLIEETKKDDKVYVHDFSKLAWNNTKLSQIVDELENKNAHIVSLKEDFDTSTDTGQAMARMLRRLVEFNKDINYERQKEGIVLAQAAGKYKGRQKIVVPGFEKYYQQYIDKKITKSKIAQLLNISRPTVDRLIKDFKNQ